MTKKPISPVVMWHPDYAQHGVFGQSAVPTEAVRTWQKAGWIILEEKDVTE